MGVKSTPHLVLVPWQLNKANVRGNAIKFEPHFYEEMMGFRPDRGCHRALRMLNEMIMYRTGYIVDADIRSFFDHMDHGWIIKFVESKIKDPNITRLLRRLLKAGIMNGHSYEETEEGSGQGSVCSPILSCIYMHYVLLHYVLLWWFKEKIQPEMKGFCGIVNYADDFVCCFQYKEEAERFYERLKHRMEHFGLNLAEEIMRCDSDSGKKLIKSMVLRTADRQGMC